MSDRVKVIPYPDFENAFVVISARKSDKSGNGVAVNMSFFYDNDGRGAEWGPEYGPITKLKRCGRDHPQAEKHWYYDFFTGMGHWSQLSVESEGLPGYFLEGDYHKIFEVLREWAGGEQ